MYTGGDMNGGKGLKIPGQAEAQDRGLPSAGPTPEVLGRL